MTQDEEIKALKARIEALEQKFSQIQSAFIVMALADLHAIDVKPGDTLPNDSGEPTSYQKMTSSHDRAFKLLGMNTGGDGNE